MRWCLLSTVAALSAPKVDLQKLFQPQETLLCDPVTKEPLTVSVRVSDGVEKVYTSPTATYGHKGPYLDLVNPKGTVNPRLARSLEELVQTDTFRSPLTAFLYERGWRDNFKRSGFPGIENEFEEVVEFFGEPKIVVDLSCGTGLMLRRLRAKFVNSRVLGADFSEAMLREANRRERNELLRVDVAALPFVDGGLDAVHAGAALHCWPQLETGLKEISRSLKKDGKFFATTFLKGAMGTSTTRTNGFRFFTLDELDQLAKDAGFEQVEVRQEGSACAVLKCIK